MKPDAPRDQYSGAEGGPTPPFPLKLSGPVVKGFGRGSKELGIPTANIPISGLKVAGQDDLESGVYFGFAGLEHLSPPAASTPDGHTPAPHRVGPMATIATSTQHAPSLSSLRQSGPEHQKGKVYPMVMSLGYNPYYKNTARSVEVHIMHKFPRDFYDSQMKLLILGFIRPEYDYVSKDALIEDINMDIQVARRSLERESWKTFGQEEWLIEFDHKQEGTE